jgi:DNA mismatch repair protein MutS
MSDHDLTPLMRQYREIKRTYQEAILMFRVGDFYEMFYEDAEAASQLLSIALTSRDRARVDPVPLCGVPHHAATGYIAKLLKAGRTVALCEQVEDPKSAKGLIRREVVRLYTPGTLIETELLPTSEAMFLSAVTAAGQSLDGPVWGLAALDSSTGEFWIMEGAGDAAHRTLHDELYRLEPREILYPEGLPAPIHSLLSGLKGPRLCARAPYAFEVRLAERVLQEQFRVSSLDGFGCRGMALGVQAAGAVLRYL